MVINALTLGETMITQHSCAGCDGQTDIQHDLCPNCVFGGKSYLMWRGDSIVTLEDPMPILKIMGREASRRKNKIRDHFIDRAFDRVINSVRDYEGWVSLHCPKDEETGTYKEPEQANPDSLAEDALARLGWGEQRPVAQLLNRAVNTLKGTDRVIMEDYLQSVTQEQIAERIGVNQRTVGRRINKLITKLAAWCKAHEND